jgi:membrane fusion protein, multidrug efflux system
MTLVNAARLAVLVLAVAVAGCGQGQQAAQPLPAVTVTNPVQRSVVDQDEYVGRFVAVNSVEIRSRLAGYLSEIHFQDGQLVKQGDLLFTIDRRPFEIALEQMRANLAQARANLSFAQGDLDRGQS